MVLVSGGSRASGRCDGDERDEVPERKVDFGL